jgi:hypothetical protein
LITAMRERLANKEQVLIFLNRHQIFLLFHWEYLTHIHKSYL